jgi:ankyrin repeat protein
MELGNRYTHFVEPFPELVHWISQQQSYCDWKKGDLEAPYVLSFTGHSGLSASLLTSHIIAMLQNTVEHAIIIDYSMSTCLEHAGRPQLVSFYASLIRQILCSRPRLLHNVAPVYDNLRGEEGMLNLNVLENILLRLLRRCTFDPVFCVVHGITEENFTVLEPALGLLNRVGLSSVCKFALLGDAPQLTDSSHTCKTHPHINLTRETWQPTAIRAHVQSKVGKLIRKRREWESCADDLVKKLAADSTTFPQATLGVRILDTADLPSTRGAALEFLNQLPSSLDELYTIGVQQARRRCSVPVLLSMQWVFHAFRPLTLHELAIATALSSPGLPSIHHLRNNLPLNIIEDIRYLEGVLVHVIGLDVHPAHEAMSFAFVGEQHLDDDDPHGTIVQRLLEYLEMILASEADPCIVDPPQTGASPVRPINIEFELVAYAVTFLTKHYKNVRDASVFKDRLLDILENERFPAVLFRVRRAQCDGVRTNGQILEVGSAIKAASFYGLADLVQGAIDRVKSSESFDKIKYSEDLSDALQLAVIHDHFEVVKLLLEEDTQSAGSMCLAAKFGFMDIVKTLFHTNQNLINEEDKCGQTPLDLAVMAGYPDITAFLLTQAADKGIILSLNSIKPLCKVAATGQTRILQLLIRTGLYTSRLNEAKTTMLRTAAASGFDEIIQLLLEDSELDVNSRNIIGITAYHFAVSQGNSSTCELLAARADVNMPTADGLSAIHLAAQYGQLRTLRSLLKTSAPTKKEAREPEKGLGVDQMQEVRFEDGRSHDHLIFDASTETMSPLHLAALYGHLDVLKELLKHEQYNSQRDRAIALLQAATGGWTKIVEELLQSDITMAMKDTAENTALHIAAQRQSSEISKLLLDLRTESGARVFDVNAANSGGETPLHLAMKRGRLLIVQILMQQDPRPKIHALTRTGQTALHYAAAHGHTLVVNELLQHLSWEEGSDRPDVCVIPDQDGNTAFTLALRSGQAGIARALLKRVERETTSRERTGMKFAARDLAGEKNALLAAVQGNSEECVTLLFENDLVSITNGEPRTMGIHIAALNGSVPMITLLHEHGADIKDENEEGETPLHLACRSSSSEAVKLLLDLGAQVNALDRSGATPLFRAAYEGRVEAIAVLLSSPHLPDLNIKTSTEPPGWTALHAAYDNPEITRMLLEAGADPTTENKNGDPPFFLAAGCYSNNTVQEYLNAANKVDPNTRSSKDGMTALHIAAGLSGDAARFSLKSAIEVCRILLAEGANINATADDGETPIHLAASAGQLEMVQYLVRQHNIDLEVDCKAYGTPLMTAAGSGGPDIVQIFLDADARVDATSDKYDFHTALQAAASSGSEDIICMLLERKDADVNATGGIFGSALCAAVAANNMACIERLLDKGADINSDEGKRGTALELAIENNNWVLVDNILDEKYGVIDVNNISSGRHRTALVAAIESGNLEYVKKLLALQADPNVFAKDQEAPIHVAVKKGGREIVKALVEFGADVSHIDETGMIGGRNILVSGTNAARRPRV